MTLIKVNRRKIEISKPDKPIFPEDNISKMELVEYYRKMAPYMLPYLKNRPAMLQRFPDGIKQEGFYQKEASDYFPSWINTISVKLKQKSRNKQRFVNCNSEAALAYLADQATITPHTWLSTKNHLNKPDKLIYDLDPPKGKFELVREGARELKKLLDELNLSAFLMTTGSKGLHVIIPLRVQKNFDEIRDFASSLAEHLSQQYPDKYTVETRKDKRKGRLFLDYLRNAYGQTSVAPYALRPLKGAPVATPIGWDELNDDALTAQRYTYHNIFKRLANKTDPWKKYSKQGNKLKKAMKRLKKIRENNGKA